MALHDLLAQALGQVREALAAEAASSAAAKAAETARIRAEVARIRAERQAERKALAEEANVPLHVLLARDELRRRVCKLESVTSELAAASSAAQDSLLGWAGEIIPGLAELAGTAASGSGGPAARAAQEGLKAFAEALVAGGWAEPHERPAVARLFGAQRRAREALAGAETALRGASKAAASGDEAAALRAAMRRLEERLRDARRILEREAIVGLLLQGLERPARMAAEQAIQEAEREASRRAAEARRRAPIGTLKELARIRR
ncbi:MAG TPA: hypothetical protein VIL08_03470 [Limnochorda sp.]